MDIGRENFLCIDHNEHSLVAFNFYVANYHRNDDKVYLVYVHKMPVIPVETLNIGEKSSKIDPQVLDDYQKKCDASTSAMQEMQNKYEAICNELSINHEFLISNSQHSPGRVICNLAKEKSADAIFMGQRGLGTISRSLLGSTSDYVLHHADIPVMVIPFKK